jgi:acyl-CoA thioesterase
MAEVIRLRPAGAGKPPPDTPPEPPPEPGTPRTGAEQHRAPGVIGPERAEAIERARRSAERMYAADAASSHLGIEISDVRPGHAVARMLVTATMVNGHGVAHGGYLFLLADTAFAFACNTYGTPTVARGAEVQFIAPARAGDQLVATAYERARYGRSGIYDVTVRRSDGGIIAEFRGQSHVLATDAGQRENQPTERDDRRHEPAAPRGSEHDE